MADHLREQIMDAIVTALTGLTTTSTNVHRARVYPQEKTKLPSLNILQGDDVPMDEDDGQVVMDKIDRRLTVMVEARVQATTGQVDETLNLIDKEVTIALQADYTQGVTGVINTIQGQASEPELSGEVEKKTAMMVMLWDIYYRVSRTDPSAS